MVRYQLRIPPQEGKLRGDLFNLNCISEESYAEDGDWLVEIHMPLADWQRLAKRSDADLASFIVQSLDA